MSKEIAKNRHRSSTDETSAPSTVSEKTASLSKTPFSTHYPTPRYSYVVAETPPIIYTQQHSKPKRLESPPPPPFTYDKEGGLSKKMALRHIDFLTKNNHTDTDTEQNSTDIAEQKPGYFQALVNSMFGACRGLGE